MPARQLAVLAVALALGLCNCLTSAQDDNVFKGIYVDLQCNQNLVFRPKNTSEVAQLVRQYYKASLNGGAPHRIRATVQDFRSSASFPCPDARYTSPAALSTWLPPNTSKAPVTVVIDQQRMTQVLKANAAKGQIRMQAGASLSQLIAAADIAGLSLPHNSVPNWGGLTLGGMLATHAHGTGAGTISALSEMVVDITWVDGKGDVRTSARDSAFGRALCGGLGIVGVVTELTLQLQPRSRSRWSTVVTKDDKDLMADIDALLKENPRVTVLWRPDLGSYTAWSFRPATFADISNGGHCTVLKPVQGYESATSNALLRATQLDPSGKTSGGAAAALCAIGVGTSVGLKWGSNFLGQEGNSGVGDTSRVNVCECGDKCFWDSQLTEDDLEFTVDRSKLGAWISDVRKLVALDLKKADPRGCLGMAYVQLRFGSPNADLLATATGLPQPVFVEFAQMHSREVPALPARNAFIIDGIELLSLCKYKGRPHFGKNFDRTFSHPACHVRDTYGASFDELLRMQAKFDPQAMFEPQLFARMAARQSYAYSPGCDVSHQCYCAKDAHCGAGFHCVPLVSFPQYKVCKPKSAAAAAVAQERASVLTG